MTTRRLIRLLALGSTVLALLCSEAAAAVLDESFGKDGRVAVELGIFGSRANAVATQHDGKIVAAGYASSTADRDFMLFRLLADGSLDPTFNSDGTVTTAIGSFDDEALAVAVQPDGKIIAAGYSNNGANRDFALARYNSDGSIDSDFGNAGLVVTAVGNSHDEITDIVVQEDGRIVISGAAQAASGKVAVLARYSANGSPDTSFATQGFSLSEVGNDTQAEGVAIGKDGRILLSGSYSDGQRRGLMLLGFDSKGQLDKEFGENGIAVPADNSVFSEGYGMLVNEDGTVLVAGAVGDEGKRDAALFRFTSEGRPDSSFERNGVLVTATSSAEDDVLYDLVVIGETIAAAGFKTTEEQREFLLVIYNKKTGETEENSGSLTVSAVVTTGFGSDNDTSTALAAVSEQSVVAVGESEAEVGSSAAVSKYTMAAATDSNTTTSSSLLAAGSQYVWTGAPYDVTRTTAILPAEVRSTLSGTITKRGIVFGPQPNPSLKDSSSTSGDGSSAPVLSDISPQSETFDEGSVTLQVKTDVDASCKYDDTAGTAYDQMENEFSTEDGNLHLKALTSVTEGNYNYYVRCKNTSSSAVNTTDSKISFSVSGTEDTAPVLSNISPQSGTFDEGSVTLQVKTDVDASYKYDDTAETAYDQMKNDFSTEDGNLHLKTLTSVAEGSYSYYVRCKNTSSGVANTTDGVISFSVGSTEDKTPPEITNKTESTFKSGDDTTLAVKTDEVAECNYDTEDVSFDEMDEEFIEDATGKNHSADLGNALAVQQHSYYVRCKDEAGNVNTSGKKISFTITASLIPTTTTLLASSDQLINTALGDVGNFFIGTALAETSETDTSETGSSSTTATTTSSTTSTTTTKFIEEGSTNEGGGSGAFSSKLSNLKPGTFFYARAYAISDGVTYYGNQVGFRTADSCFIATAAFGSVFHPAVQVLREFRNQFLSANPVGRAAVELYYQVSPSLADLVSRHSGLRTVVRLLLLPLTGAAWLVLQLGLGILLLPAAVAGLAWGWQGFRHSRACRAV